MTTSDTNRDNYLFRLARTLYTYIRIMSADISSRTQSLIKRDLPAGFLAIYLPVFKTKH